MAKSLGIVKVRIVLGPPEQDLLTRSVGLSGAQSPAPRGAFCYGLLTAILRGDYPGSLGVQDTLTTDPKPWIQVLAAVCHPS